MEKRWGNNGGVTPQKNSGNAVETTWGCSHLMGGGKSTEAETRGEKGNKAWGHWISGGLPRCPAWSVVKSGCFFCPHALWIDQEIAKARLACATTVPCPTDTPSTLHAARDLVAPACEGTRGQDCCARLFHGHLAEQHAV